jgi:hypothetical protein
MIDTIEKTQNILDGINITRNMFPKGVWDFAEKEQRIVKKYKIEDDVFTCPIEKSYQLVTPYQSARTFNKIPLNIKFEECKSTPEELIEQFLQDEDSMMNWIDDIECPDPIYEKLYKFQIVERIFMTLAIDELNTEHAWSKHQVQISNTVIMESDEIESQLKSNPLFDDMVKRASDIRKANILIAQETERSRKKTIVENNYQMWKALNEKYKAGEFEEFITE